MREPTECIRLGLVVDLTTWEEILGALRHHGDDKLLATLRANRITRQAYVRLSAYGALADAAELRRVIVLVKHILQPSDEQLISLQVAARFISEWQANHDAPVLAIKGMAARRWYSPPEIRDLTDLDLWAASIGIAKDLAKAFRDNLGRTSHLDRAAKVLTIQAANPAELPIDIHYGRPLRMGLSELDIHCGLAEWDDRLGLHSAGPTETLLITLLGTSPNSTVLAKSVNDFYLVSQDPRIDWTTIQHQLSAKPVRIAAAQRVVQALDRLYGARAPDIARLRQALPDANRSWSPDERSYIRP